jgi:ATP-binding cassette subfamily B protein
MQKDRASSFRYLLPRLWGSIGSKRKIQLWVLLFLMILSSLSEVLSLGAVIPFLAMLTAPDKLYEYKYVESIATYFGVNNAAGTLLPLTLLFVAAILLAGITRLCAVWYQTRISHEIGEDLSLSIYRLTLYQPFSAHILRNSSEVISGIGVKTIHVVNGIVMPILNIINSVFLLTSILTVLIYIEPAQALIAIFSIGSIYAVIIFSTKKKLMLYGRVSSGQTVQVLKALQEGLGGIRDILIGQLQPYFLKIYSDIDKPRRRTEANILIIASTPRYLIEALATILIALMAYIIASGEDGVSNAIPILGLLALGAQRILPLAQSIFSGWSIMVGSKSSLEDVLGLLNQATEISFELDNSVFKTFEFKNLIEFQEVSFSYENRRDVLNLVSFSIPRGSRLGIIGNTGSGKSTFIDIFMGLLQPTTGCLVVDGQVISSVNARDWQKNLSHVPQSIFLSEASVAENIAFGIPGNKIDMTRVKEAARKAQISSSIDSWALGYETLVGERGVRLSGGERQRIGIARALYKDPKIIIFDEATSALDNQTESDVMMAIERLSNELTVIIVAHRLSTLKGCTQIIELMGGKINRIGNYSKIIGDV